MEVETVMVAPAEVAERDGVTRQAVTKTVRQLVADHDLPVERDGRGRVVRFSLGHYDHYRDRFDSSAKVNAGRQPAAEDAEPSRTKPSPDPNSRDEALRREAWLKVSREQLRHQETIGQLRRADTTDLAIAECGREIQALIARLPNRADELALAVSKEGAHGLRVALRQVAFELNSSIADRMQAVAEKAPDSDSMIEEAEI